ncbi:MAG: RnfABCDGE type electron transport complex subunit D [Thermoanaerobaculia bacterium]|nr:RnfABCDGE type electron transport complex subunit D [Thermoanaerobaculia bacterium]
MVQVGATWTVQVRSVVCSAGVRGCSASGCARATGAGRAAGAWIYGLGIGVLVVVIRIWGGMPEGVMYAILLMNAATPLIERFDQPRAFGRAGLLHKGRK